MANPPSSQLPRYLQLTISATNLPFLAIAYLWTLVLCATRSVWHLLCHTCRENWVFLCIFYLHLWQTFKDLPPIRPVARHWRGIVATLLFAGCAAPAGLILHASILLFRLDWENWKDERRTEIVQHLAFFVVTCAPACTVLSAASTAAYFMWKQRKHGQYQASMRKLGRGYWADPRDLEDWRKWKSRKDAVDRLKAWEATNDRRNFIVDVLCVGCGIVKAGLSRRCKMCGAYDEKYVRRQKIL
ncbi:hypothetical protein BU25DRAFT_132789 [Macroventuria anomochaeta]|uniref:Uncharacterized protein n=1 Tax=Macroventuria anomochaeta TaxID=301207 RepID=A0ACB6RTV0_9PLEO|nr:uncharacterized protein BU25DRAFT_132789 [Macroventuria anomochaeta]KAF2624717.1 hypothetical protein BU25DRAFT_132789 [Macroventuria anomochaeta]